MPITVFICFMRMGPFCSRRHHLKLTESAENLPLARLVHGNRRFCRGEAHSDAFPRETLAELAKAQRPTLRSWAAAIHACLPSGFSIPAWENCLWCVAGNILSPEIAGTLQYAGSYLQTPLFVVLGHEGCGAITAALATKHEGEQFRARVQLLLASIVSGLPELDSQPSPQEQLSRAVESNVRWTVRQILD